MLYHVVSEENIVILAFLYIFTYLLCQGDIFIKSRTKEIEIKLSLCLSLQPQQNFSSQLFKNRPVKSIQFHL